MEEKRREKERRTRREKKDKEREGKGERGVRGKGKVSRKSEILSLGKRQSLRAPTKISLARGIRHDDEEEDEDDSSNCRL